MKKDKPVFNSFKEYRPYQLEATDSIISGDKKVFFLDAPTGSGKSLIGMTVGQQYLHSLYLCTTKPLQHQLTKDFPGIPILMGRGNYPCVLSPAFEEAFPEISCEDCPRPSSRAPQMDASEAPDEILEHEDCRKRCRYRLAKKSAQEAHIAILNSAYYLYETNYSGAFKARSMIIVDEADKIEEQLVKFVSLRISDRILNRLQMEKPKYKTKVENWKEWAKHYYPFISKESIDAKLRVMQSKFRDIQAVRWNKTISALLNKLSMFINIVDETWLYQEYEKYVEFKPTWVSSAAKIYLWDTGQRFLLMSATILNPEYMGKILGLESSDWDYFQIPSQFPAERRQVRYLPIANITHKTAHQEIQKVVEPIKKILDRHPRDKGLIHTVSYTNAQYVYSHVNHDGRLIGHDTSGRQALLKMFRESKDPLVIVSPSMDRGVDLPYDLCRFIIILKIPYPDLSDKQISARVYSSNFGQRWYNWTTACTIVQMSGRGMRAADDQCTVYILDKQFEIFYGRNHKFFPIWYKEAIVIEEE